ncbi:MAG: ATP-binding cassette domain-containing protein, partial [Clostridia bacterium]|nr:ATP-binding cassette domain-containing protein [Clostridia bacterium]
IFENLNLNIKKGEFVIIVGGNGAGKSTLMNLISGSILPDTGKIFIDGKDVTNFSEHKRAKFIVRAGDVTRNYVDTNLNTKVDKVAGKGLSTNDYDNRAKAAVDALGTASTHDTGTNEGNVPL